ncbi:hypothetical protein EOT50_11670 [Listeria monocytogenes]|nr:hypothetical protein [Listeria monocytogenes]EAC3423697.1 hypothetical protein [Listeria monocytogenes]EAD2103829.1 hypothetical protein [Listeria monocytogenes]EAD3070654.1 hypothetical protein [Listeria monocytogenes]EAD4729077.1 hypothetical protein [Listeria monocytogenes]
MSKEIDYIIYLQPIYLEVTCPHCKERLIMYDGDGVNFDECFSEESDGVCVNCSECLEEIHLGDFKEVVE